MKIPNLRFILISLNVLAIPLIMSAKPLSTAHSLNSGDQLKFNTITESVVGMVLPSDQPDTLALVLNFLNDDIRFPTLPYYTYGSGLGITSPDSTFRMNIRFRMQNRASFNINDGRDNGVEGVVRRLRLRFDGFVGDPSFLYAIQLSFAPGDVGALEDGENLNVIRDAMFFYRPNDRVNLGFGQTKLPGNRQRLNSSGALQLTDRSINNARFTIDRDYGVHAYYLNEDENAFSWNIKTAVSTGNGRNWTKSPSTDLAYTGRVELMPFGALSGGGMFFEGDILREQTPKLLLATTYHVNYGARRSQGQTGTELFETRDLTSFFVDAMFKYKGFAAMYAYMSRSVEGNPLTVSTPFQVIGGDPAPGPVVGVFAGNGHDWQLSYIFPSNYELIGRYSVQHTRGNAGAVFPDVNQLSFGLTRYIWEHTLKLQAEVTRTETVWQADARPSTEDWYLRFQIEIGI
ncbi:MAG: OprO/OprP family phosphate-selective porin [Balneolales bacterium]|nr:OprO/OprP family phosphate-selective porin [Balneolales bacterium]